jgi:hypothetical protein
MRPRPLRRDREGRDPMDRAPKDAANSAQLRLNRRVSRRSPLSSLLAHLLQHLLRMSLELPALANRSCLHLSSFHRSRRLFLQALTIQWVTIHLSSLNSRTMVSHPFSRCLRNTRVSSLRTSLLLLLRRSPPMFNPALNKCQRCLLERSKNNLRFSSQLPTHMHIP